MKKLPCQFLRLPCQSGFRCVTHTPCDIGLMDRLVTVSVFTRNFLSKENTNFLVFFNRLSSFISQESS